jgi:dTDP-glucose 4,6-dehydratase/UDP-glucose 4-epimerase
MNPDLYQLDSLRPEDHLLILGSTGLFGSHLLPRIFSYLDSTTNPASFTIVCGDKARSVSRFPKLNHSHINLVNCNLLVNSSIPVIDPPSHILHMANVSAAQTFSGTDQLSKYTLLCNSVALIKSVARSGTTRKIVFTSSGVAYGDSTTYNEAENSSINHLNPLSSLGFAKINAEYLLNMLALEINASLTICRCFSFVSPYLPVDLHYALGNFVSNAIHGNPIVIKGDGTELRSYQHVDDAIDWIISILFMNQPPLLLNVGSSRRISIKDLAGLVRRLVNPDITINILNQHTESHNFRRTSYVPSLLVSSRLGLRNRRTLEDSIIELAAANSL